MENLNDLEVEKKIVGLGEEIQIEKDVWEEWNYFEDVLEDVKNTDQVDDLLEEAEKCIGDKDVKENLKDSNRSDNEGSCPEDQEPFEDAPEKPEKLDDAQDSGGGAKNYVKHPESYTEYPVGGPPEEKTYFFRKGVNHLGHWLKSKDKKNRTVKYKRYIDNSFFLSFRLNPLQISPPPRKYITADALFAYPLNFKSRLLYF